MHLTPAAYVIHVFKGVRATARAVGRAPSNVSRWARTSNEQGDQGYIPNKAHRPILEAAKRLNLNITPTHLILGGEVEVEDEASDGS